MTVRQTDVRDALGLHQENAAAVYYDRYAASLADGYEAVSLEAAHPALLKILQTEFAGKELSVLDVGAGTGRDAAWFAKHGHKIVAVEPSAAMQMVGERLHADAHIDWRMDSLPSLDALHGSGDRFDLIVLSAVWMHVPPSQRPEALRTVAGLLKSGGLLYVTLRLGPEEPNRGIYTVSLEEFRTIAEELGLNVSELGSQDDLLGRAHIKWKAVSVSARE